MRDLLNKIFLTEASMFPQMMGGIVNALHDPKWKEYLRGGVDSGSYLRSIRDFSDLHPRREINTFIIKTLRYYFATQLIHSARGDPEAPGMPLLQKIVGTYESSAVGFTTEDAAMSYDEAQETIENTIIKHYLGIPWHKFENYRLGNKSISATIAELRSLEEEFQKLSDGSVKAEPGDEIIMSFPDGKVWMRLARGFCKAEARAMGHCGNAGARGDDRIVSLRTPTPELGKDMYRPHLTFILDGQGKLGEMKGRANEKPAPRYHPYIVALLKSDYVKQIKGGGYKPQNNFDISHLPDDEQETLLDEKPGLEKQTFVIDEDMTEVLDVSGRLGWYDSGYSWRLHLPVEPSYYYLDNNYSRNLLLVSRRAGKDGVLVGKILAVAGFRNENSALGDIQTFHATDITTDGIVALLESDLVDSFAPITHPLFTIQHSLPEATSTRLMKKNPQLSRYIIPVANIEKKVQADLFQEWVEITDYDRAKLMVKQLGGNIHYRDTFYYLGSKFVSDGGETFYDIDAVAEIVTGTDKQLRSIVGFEDQPTPSELDAGRALLMSNLVDSFWKETGSFELDLYTKEERDEMLDHKPAIGNPRQLWEHSGDTPTLRTRLIETLKRMDGNLDYDVVGEFDDNNLLILAKWGDVATFAQKFADSDSEYYFKDGQDDIQIDTNVEESDVESFFDDLPIQVRAAVLAKAKENYLADNEIDDEDEVDDIEEMELIRDSYPEAWDALESACHTGQEVGAQNEVYDSKMSALQDAKPTAGEIVFVMHEGSGDKEYIDWDEPVYLKVSLKDFFPVFKDYESDDSLPEDFMVDDMKVQMSDNRYGYSGFDQEAAVERFWEDTDLDQSEFPKAPKINLEKFSVDQLREKLKDAIDMIPDGMAYKKYNVDQEDRPEELRNWLSTLIKQYYG